MKKKRYRFHPQSLTKAATENGWQGLLVQCKVYSSCLQDNSGVTQEHGRAAARSGLRKVAAALADFNLRDTRGFQFQVHAGEFGVSGLLSHVSAVWNHTLAAAV